MSVHVRVSVHGRVSVHERVSLCRGTSHVIQLHTRITQHKQPYQRRTQPETHKSSAKCYVPVPSDPL